MDAEPNVDRPFKPPRVAIPSSSPKMTVDVKWSRRKLAGLALDPCEPPAAFKARLAALTGVEPQRQKIMVKGAVVKDDADWSTYTLKDGMTLVMMGAPSARTIAPPEVWSVVRHGWASHGLEGHLTPLQAALLRLSAAGLLHARLGADARSDFVVDDADVFARILQNIASSAKLFVLGANDGGEGTATLRHRHLGHAGAAAARAAARAEARDPFAASGVLHDIATEGGASQWTNPHAAERVTVTSSSSAAGNNLACFVAPGPAVRQAAAGGTATCVTGDEPGSWVCVDLGEDRRLAVDRYALRVAPADLQLTRLQLRARGLVSMGGAWELQGALEAAGPWALLKRHYYGELDDSPGGGSPRVAPSPFLGAASASWAVDGGGAPGWRFFRVVQTAPNGRETEMQQMQAQTQRRRMEDMRRRADQQQAAQQAAQQDVQDWAAQQQQQQGQGPQGPVQQGPVQQQPPGDQQQGPVQQQPPDGQQPLPHQDQQYQQDQQQQGQQQLPAAVPPQPADQRPPPQPVQPLQPPPAQPAPLTPPRQQGNGSNVSVCDTGHLAKCPVSQTDTADRI